MVTLSGVYFTGSTVVTFGGVPAASITVVNDSTIYATVGNGLPAMSPTWSAPPTPSTPLP